MRAGTPAERHSPSRVPTPSGNRVTPVAAQHTSYEGNAASRMWARCHATVILVMVCRGTAWMCPAAGSNRSHGRQRDVPQQAARCPTGSACSHQAQLLNLQAQTSKHRHTTSKHQQTQPVSVSWQGFNATAARCGAAMLSATTLCAATLCAGPAGAGGAACSAVWHGWCAASGGSAQIPRGFIPAPARGARTRACC